MHAAVGWTSSAPPKNQDDYLRLSSDHAPNNVPVPKGTLVETDPASLPAHSVNVISLDNPDIKVTVLMKVRESTATQLEHCGKEIPLRAMDVGFKPPVVQCYIDMNLRKF